ncbi:class I SAM-dependent methyltransferase [Candidatus Margulisiibacteriota bacterium]
MTLKLIKKFNHKKISLPHNGFLIFDYNEGEGCVEKLAKGKSALALFFQELVKKRLTAGKTDYRLNHTLSTALKYLVRGNIGKGELLATLKKVYGSPKDKELFSNEFIHATAQITYKGRHLEMDNFVKDYFQGKKINYLDIGCCPEVNGAVTTEDTYAVLQNAEITALDLYYPDNFNPKNKKIKYLQGNILEMDFADTMYDVVRCVNVEVYFSAKNKKLLREKLTKALKPKGLYICGSESIGYYVYKKEQEK